MNTQDKYVKGLKMLSRRRGDNANVTVRCRFYRSECEEEDEYNEKNKQSSK